MVSRRRDQRRQISLFLLLFPFSLLTPNRHDIRQSETSNFAKSGLVGFLDRLASQRYVFLSVQSWFGLVRAVERGDGAREEGGRILKLSTELPMTLFGRKIDGWRSARMGSRKEISSGRKIWVLDLSGEEGTTRVPRPMSFVLSPSLLL